MVSSKNKIKKNDAKSSKKSEEFTPGIYVKTKFAEDFDNMKVVVPIEKIVELKNREDQNDLSYDWQKIYSCLWEDEKNPDELEYPIVISKTNGIRSKLLKKYLYEI